MSHLEANWLIKSISSFAISSSIAANLTKISIIFVAPFGLSISLIKSPDS